MQQQATIQVLLIYRKKGHRPSASMSTLLGIHQAIKLENNIELWLRN